MSLFWKKLPCASMLVLIGCLVLSSSIVKAQQAAKDTATNQQLHSPRKATIFSAVVPGLGQAYNKKYWKIPILYAGFAGLGYLIHVNHREYVIFRDAYVKKLDTDATNDVFDTRRYALNDLKILKDGYRRNRDLTIITTFIVYVLNVLDANVDAHLFYFNVNDDLSLNLQPVTLPTYKNDYSGMGLSLKVQF